MLAIFFIISSNYLPPVVSPTLGGSRFEYTSGGSCGCACNVPPKNWDIYLRCYSHLPPVGLRCLPAVPGDFS